MNTNEEMQQMETAPRPTDFWSLLKRTLLAFVVAFVVYCMMLLVVGFASVRNLFPSDPTIKLLLLCLGVNGVASFCGVLAGTARLFEQRLKVALIIGSTLFAYDAVALVARIATGHLSLSGRPDDVWFSLAWYVGIVAAVLMRAHRPSIVAEHVGAG
jgi:hypothetical protein